VLFLLSGGGSALFEKPLITAEEMTEVTNILLASGASIVEMNTIRKRLSGVKGGRFAQICAPAKVFTIVLSDIIGDKLDMIASGPTYPDSSTCEQAMEIVKKYHLGLPQNMMNLLKQETPKALDNSQIKITGSVRQLCRAAEQACFKLGYDPVVLTASLCCNARDAGSFFASIAQYYKDTERSLAFIAGGETVVRLTGKGLGGRNQELALSAAEGISGLRSTALFSVGSDGTDGPTDAAGGFVDNNTATVLERQGINISYVLADNDSYHALENCGGLIFTGATGTNVNDLTMLLIRR
jgi:hydroxypyruvate reductase